MEYLNIKRAAPVAKQGDKSPWNLGDVFYDWIDDDRQRYQKEDRTYNRAILNVEGDAGIGIVLGGLQLSRGMFDPLKCNVEYLFKYLFEDLRTLRFTWVNWFMFSFFAVSRQAL
jgi:hypothetical protein